MKLDSYFPLVKSVTKQKGIAWGFAVCLTLLFLLQKLFITMDLNVKKKKLIWFIAVILLNA